jgi:hypothetical protein
MCKRQVGFVVFSLKLLFLLATRCSCPDSSGVAEPTADPVRQRAYQVCRVLKLVMGFSD